VNTAETGYTFGAVAQILGLSESKLRYWSQVGFVGPSRRHAGRQVFTFQDLVTVKAAKELVERGFSTGDIRKALETVRVALPGLDHPLDRLRVAFDGDALVVVEGGAAFEVTGQRLFDFGLAELAAQAAPEATPLAVQGQGPAARERTAYDWFLEGLRIEVEDEAEAELCYRRALDGDPGLAAAHTNLGALAYRRDDSEGARRCFEAALACDPDQPEARYNLATLLYEAGEVELAASELRRVVQAVPSFADAHYNLATALERLGSKRQAGEHLEQYLALLGEGTADQAPWIADARSRLRLLTGQR
jgi:tetratricopeptide (TPR) repeat protein